MCGLVDEEQAAGAEQLGAVAERAPYKGRRMQHIGRDHDMVLAQRKALQRRIHVNVEQRILHDSLRLKALASPPQEALGHVGEHVALAFSA